MRNWSSSICLVCVAALAGCGRDAQPARPAAGAAGAAKHRDSAAVSAATSKVSTFSIVAMDPETGICGAAVASKYPAVGRVVPYVRGGVGAFCTQHFLVAKFGPRALELLEQEKSPQAILAELVRDDAGAGGRQLAIVDRHGRTAQLNPIAAPRSSNWWGAMSGRYYACQGNTLAGRGVVEAMAAAYETTSSSLADRVMAALVAGDRAGGDHRGRLAAGLVIDKPGANARDGDEPESQSPWLALYIDQSDDAVAELAKKYAALEHEAKGAPPQQEERPEAERNAPPQ